MYILLRIVPLIDARYIHQYLEACPFLFFLCTRVKRPKNPFGLTMIDVSISFFMIVRLLKTADLLLS